MPRRPQSRLNNTGNDAATRAMLEEWHEECGARVSTFLKRCVDVFETDTDIPLPINRGQLEGALQAAREGFASRQHGAQILLGIQGLKGFFSGINDYHDTRDETAVKSLAFAETTLKNALARCAGSRDLY